MTLLAPGLQINCKQEMIGAERLLTCADSTWEGAVALGLFSNRQPTDSREFLAHNLVHTRVSKIHLKMQMTID